MLLRQFLWVAAVFLVTTVFLFVHLSSLGDKHLDIIGFNKSPRATVRPDLRSNIQKEEEPDLDEDHALILDSESNSTSIEDSESMESEEREIIPPYPKVNFEDVHVFYYPWYANVETDGKWSHWDHHILPHWNADTRARFKHGIQYVPPDDIGANFYPSRGPYSSKDPELIESHMSELRNYVVVISWWGTRGADGEGSPTNSLVPAILKAAEKYGARIAIHLEPYEGRNAKTVKEDIEYIYDQYGSSPALYRTKDNRIVIYIYDSYHTTAPEWSTIFDRAGHNTIRGTPHDVVAIGLYLQQPDKRFLLDSHFDGFYTYFAAEGFTHGSTSSNWIELANWARSSNLLFSLSLGPGYDDTRIRPWNAEHKRDRANGKYYDHKWEIALQAMPAIVSVTSYNEWHEGSQIEAAIPKQIQHTIFSDTSYKYEDYSPLDPDHYMKKTHEWSQQFIDAKNN